MSLRVDVANMIRGLVEEGVIDRVDPVMNRMNGTTDGQVYILSVANEPKYVLKLDRPQEMILAERLLHTYRHTTLLPNLFYTDPAKEFIVYSYIPGTTHVHRGPKINWMTVLVKELLNHYVIDTQADGWGRLDFPLQSWREFHEICVEEARINVGRLLPGKDYETVWPLVERTSEEAGDAERYLLHGDTGVHNFVFDGFTLKGVIDPSPMAGPVLYDFLYAFCSSPDDLNLDTLLAVFALVRHPPMERSRLIEEAVIQLYCRIGICALHHPQDLPDYLEAWEYWKGLVRK